LEETGVILSQVFILSIAVIAGVIAAKTNVMSRESNVYLSKLIFNISLPLMLFSNFFRLEVTPRLLSNSIIVLILSAVILLFLLLLGWLWTKILKMDRVEASVFKAHSMLGNIIFLGFPLIASLYGKEGLLYASMFQLVSNILMWTVGVILFSQSNGRSWQKSIRKVLNPNTVATLTGLTAFLFSVKLPVVILTPLSGIGSTNTWLSMMYIGAMMSFSDVGGLLRRKSIYLMSLNRLLIAPFIVISLFALLKYIGVSFDNLVTSVVILEISVPCMASVVIMAREFDADDNLAMANVFVSTLLCIVTLPLILLIERALL